MEEQHNLADDLRALLREIRILFPDADEDLTPEVGDPNSQPAENQPFTNIVES